MPWEQRGRRRYYYQSVRVGGKPRRIYWGIGDVGRLHELLTTRDQRLRAKRVAAARERTETVAALWRDTRAVVGRVRQLVRGVRLVRGEYMHRGQWRWRARRRHLDGPNLAAQVRLTAPVRTFGFQLPSPFIPVITVTHPHASDPITPEKLGRHLTELNDRSNRGDRSALVELEELLDQHPIVWQTAARLATDTAAGWARLLGDGGAVAEASLRRELAAWKDGLIGPDPAPLVTAAVDAAGVAWLAQRFAERELLQSEGKKRTTSSRQLAAASRQVQDSLKLVLLARAAAEAAVVGTPDPQDKPATVGPRLFGSRA